jgi:formamidopyrimidine-DNA glycosylase
MPELPEVELTAQGLSPLIGQRCLSAGPCGQRLRWPPSPEIANLVPGQAATGVGRRAKFALLRLERHTLIFHLGMSGALRLDPPGSPLRPHDHFEARFERHWLRLNDPRRFGGVLFAPLGEEPALAEFARLGPEPLSDDFDGLYLRAAFAGRSAPAKAALMDQAVVVGVGNIYASEALHLAGVRPGRAARRLSAAECAALAQSVKSTLREALERGGSTLRDFRHVNGQSGHAQDAHRVYARAGQPCRRCGSAIREKTIGGRSSFYCPTCQR